MTVKSLGISKFLLYLRANKRKIKKRACMCVMCERDVRTRHMHLHPHLPHDTHTPYTLERILMRFKAVTTPVWYVRTILHLEAP